MNLFDHALDALLQDSSFYCEQASHACRLGREVGVNAVDNMMWGADYPHSESTFPQSRKIVAEILAGVPEDEQAKPAPDPDPGIAGGNTARVYNFDLARLTAPA